MLRVLVYSKLTARSVFGQTRISGAGVGLHAFQPGDAGRHAADMHGRVSGHLLPGQGFHELVHGETARVFGGAFGGQYMVGAAALVAIGNRGFLA